MRPCRPSPPTRLNSTRRTGSTKPANSSKRKQAYTQLVKTGPLSANLFYNLGNAEWKLGNGGEAAADYERALALEPSHPQARANLDFVREQTGARTATQEWWERALGALDANTAALLLSVCGWAALFCMAVVLMRPAGRTGPVMTLTLCLLVGGLRRRMPVGGQRSGNEGGGHREIDPGARRARGRGARRGRAARRKRSAGAGGTGTVDVLHAAGRNTRLGAIGCNRESERMRGIFEFRFSIFD